MSVKAKKRVRKAPPTGRKRGRPPKDQSPLNPTKLALMNRLYLRGVPNTVIAKEITITEGAVRYHINHSLRPLWKQGLQVDRDVLLAEIEDLKREAWERFQSDEPAETSEMVKQALMEQGGRKKDKLEIIEKAVKTIVRPGQTAWLDIVKWCISERAKLIGAYAQADDVTQKAPVVVRVEITNRAEAQEAKITMDQFRKRLANHQDN